MVQERCLPTLLLLLTVKHLLDAWMHTPREGAEHIDLPAVVEGWGMTGEAELQLAGWMWIK